jgi:Family of unknown function (DUF6152)
MRISALSLLSAKSIGVIALFGCAPALAHHSFAMFDMQKEVTLEGTIKEFQWTNPHIWVQLTVLDKAANQPVEYSLEGSGPSQLKPLGWTAETLKVGDKVSIVMHPLKSGANGGSLIKIFLDGKEIRAKS